MPVDPSVALAYPEWFVLACLYWLGMVTGLALLRLASYIGRVLRRERKWLDGKHSSTNSH